MIKIYRYSFESDRYSEFASDLLQVSYLKRKRKEELEKYSVYFYNSCVTAEDMRRLISHQSQGHSENIFTDLNLVSLISCIYGHTEHLL